MMFGSMWWQIWWQIWGVRGIRGDASPNSNQQLTDSIHPFPDFESLSLRQFLGQRWRWSHLAATKSVGSLAGNSADTSTSSARGVEKNKPELTRGALAAAPGVSVRARAMCRGLPRTSLRMTTTRSRGPLRSCSSCAIHPFWIDTLIAPFLLWRQSAISFVDSFRDRVAPSLMRNQLCHGAA
jgi:hypothetical protein